MSTPKSTKALSYKDKQREINESLVQSGFFEGDAGNGMLRRKEYPFVLRDRLKNLYADIRVDAVRYFKQNGIAWWGGYFPTGHTLSSQIACLNHLFPLRQDKAAVLSLLNTVSDGFTDVLLISENMPGFIQFEAVGGNQNFLNEGANTRGSRCTSVDALIYALHRNGKKFLIPIEWKYTESYGNADKSTEGNGKGEERLSRYTDLIKDSEYLRESTFSCCWFEPFYQLMRQTLWAEQVIKHKVTGLEADDYLHIHIIPDENAELLHRPYKCSGKGMEETWRSCLTQPEKYAVVSPEQFWSEQNNVKLREYLSCRYWSV